MGVTSEDAFPRRRALTVYSVLVRVAVIHSFYSPKVPSGENSVVLDQVDALREIGIDAQLVAVETKDRANQLGLAARSAFRVGSGFGPSPLRSIPTFRPDLIHIHNLFPNFGTRWMASTGIPTVMSVHNYRFACSNAVLFRSGEQCWECVDHGPMRAVLHGCYRNSRLATLPLAVSRRSYSRSLVSDLSALVTTSPKSNEVITRLLPGAQVKMIPNFGEGPAEFGVRPREELWLAMGRFSPEKGFADLARDWPPDRPLRFVGDGPQRETIRQRSVNKDISLLNSLNRDEMRSVMRSATGLVFPSRWIEVAPQIVVEAMRLGVPIVASEANGVADIVRESGAGATYSDRETLCVALQNVNDARDDMSRRASDYFSANWTKERWQESMVSLYHSLV